MPNDKYVKDTNPYANDKVSIKQKEKPPMKSATPANAYDLGSGGAANAARALRKRQMELDKY